MAIDKIIDDIDVLARDVAELRSQISKIDKPRWHGNDIARIMFIFILSLVLFFTVAIERHAKKIENDFKIVLTQLDIYEDVESTE